MSNYRREISRLTFLKHGMRHTKIYHRWLTMHDRCRNPQNHKYADYGGRGITVCGRWSSENGFVNFYIDVGDPPPGKTLDRWPNLNSNYEPGNVRWATSKEQANNTRRNRWLTLGKETRTLTDWAEKLGITPGTLSERLDKWPLERALTESKKERKNGKP